MASQLLSDEAIEIKDLKNEGDPEDKDLLRENNIFDDEVTSEFQG